MTCPACSRLNRLRAAPPGYPPDDPFFLAELRESYAVLHKHQPFGKAVGGMDVGGWSTLWLKDHHEHLGLLPRERQARLAADVADLAAAMHAALTPLGMRRINYECLGNVVGHIHWHLIPRFDPPADPNAGATVWVRPQHELECGVSDELRDKLVSLLRGAMTRPQSA